MPTYYLDPNSTIELVGLNWAGASTAHEALDDAVRQPTAPSSVEQVWVPVTTAGGYIKAGVSTFTLPANEAVTSIKAWVYIRGSSPGHSAEIGLHAQGSFRGLTTYTNITTAAWRSSGAYVPVSATQADIDELQVYFYMYDSSGTNRFADAAYLEVSTAVLLDKRAEYKVAWYKDRGAQYYVQSPATKSLKAEYRVFIPAPALTTLSTLADSYTPATSDPWRPIISPGTFWLGTEEYYLFATKKTKTLAEITFSVFKLAGIPLDGSDSMTYAGLTYTDFFWVGNELHFKHRNPEEWTAFYTPNYTNDEQKAWIDAGWLGKPTNTIAFTYQYLVWDTATQAFTTTSITQNFTVAADEDRRYYRIHEGSRDDFERTPSAAHSDDIRYNWYGPRNGPLVITDDQIQNYDSRGHIVEFALDPLTGEITFSTKENLFRNPAFLAYSPTNAPYEWTAPSGALAVATTAFPNEPVYGNRFLDMSVNQVAYQTVLVRNPGPHTISFYARLPGAAASVKVVLNPVNAAGSYINTSGVAVGTPYSAGTEVLSKTVAVSGAAWARYKVVFGTTDDFFSVDGGPIPKEALKFEVRFSAVTADIDLAAVQIEEWYEALPFLGLAGDTTLEYEAKPDGNYVPAPSTSLDWGFRRDDVDFNSAQSEMPNGFLCLQDDGGTSDFQLGKGGTQIYRSGTGPQDVQGRFFAPYAKLSGIGKLQPRQTFHLSGSPPREEIEPDRVVLAANSVIPIIPESSYFSDNSYPNISYSGTGKNLPASYVVSTTGNAVSNFSGKLHVETKTTKTIELAVLFYDQFDNPLLGKTASIKVVHSGGTINATATTDRSGRAKYSYTPQGGSIGVSAETVEFFIGVVTFTFTIDVV